jgi:hypothetical protein
MSLPIGFDLATDGQFRILAGFADPPKAGRVLAVEPSGQLRIELDDADGGEVLAWPLNGFEYGVDAVVYVGFAANSPDSGIVLGSKAPLPTLEAAVMDGVLLMDGSREAESFTVRRDHAGDTTLIINNASTNAAARRRLSFFRGATLLALLQHHENASEMQFTTFGATGFAFSTDSIRRYTITPDGKHGVGTGSSPATRQHIALEAGGGNAVSSVSLTSTGTWVNVLPSGTVAALLQLRAVVSRSGHAAAVSDALALGAVATVIYSNGGNTVEAEVTAGGIFRVQRSAGSAAITVALDLLWV